MSPHSTAATATTEAFLLQALGEMQSRSTVEECLREMITDIEIAKNLEEQLCVWQASRQMEAKLVAQEYALEETRAVQQEREQLERELADKLVQELWTLSERLGEYKEIKKQHEVLLVQYDEVLAKLIQTEDELQEAREGRAGMQMSHAPVPAPAPPAPAPPAPVVAAPAAQNVSTPAKKAAGESGSSGAGVEKKQQPASKNASAPDNISSSSTKPSSTVGEVVPTTPATTVSLPSQSTPAAATVVAIPEKTKTGAAQVEPTVVAIPDDGKGEPEDLQPATVVASTIVAAEDSKSTTAAAVSLEQDSEPTLKLHDLDNKIIMHVFSFLDALDILNTAQVNICMYSRVDSLFGLGGGGGNGGGHDTTDGDSSTIATNETVPTAPPSSSSYVSQPQPQPQQSSQQQQQSQTQQQSHAPPQRSASAVASTSTTTTTANTAAAATAATAAASLVAASSPFHRRGESSGGGAGEGIRGFFNMLAQPARGTKGAGSPSRGGVSSTTTTPQRRAGTAVAVAQSESAPPMNAAMASSMASKLTDAELNAIILMTERLRQKEALADRLLRERQDLEAKLEGTESVKQFLIAKVRTMEESLSRQEENETKVAQQIASDQEVIAFLDGRVQDLEHQAILLNKEREEMEKKMARLQTQAEQKAIVMGDMLQFEREKWTESEREWKATKKVLVKEVKHCRAQIIALQAERDGYREQNDMLRKAIISSTPTSHHHNREHAFAS